MAGIEISSLAEDRTMPIAVVGMGFRGAADATNVQRLWKMILEGREGWSPIPKTRWNNKAFYHPDNSRHGTINVEGGHFMVEDPSLFDAPFFNMTADEAAAMDPQQRLLLEVAYEGFENAGIPLNRVMGTKTACFVGSFCADYTDLLLRDPDAVPMYQCTNAGQSRAMVANRVSYFFDLKGPSVTVDTACSGSLVALHLACQSLRTGDASMAVAAGVNVVLSHEFMSTMSMMKFLSPDGRCYTFDENANGYARGEAIGSLLLKPLADAVKDGDTIRAVIRASGSNQDGRTPGITLPSGPLQETLIRDVYTAAGLDPLETEFVEMHGTGTQAGDPTEAGAVAKVFSPERPPDSPLRIGSIKTNVGHLEGASGIAGVIKAVLMLENSTFLPNRNFKTLNPRIPLQEWKLKVQLGPEPWETPGPHRVSVNSFGYGGSNAHVVLEDASGYLTRGVRREKKGASRIAGATVLPPKANGLKIHSRGLNVINHNHQRQHFKSRLFVVSGFDEQACSSQVRQLHSYLEENGPGADDEFMNNLAFTLNERRTRFPWKAAVVGDSPEKVTDAFSGAMKPKRAVKKPSIGFIFTGQGAQWCGMGKELLSSYPIFRRSVERIDAYLKRIEAPFTIKEEVMTGQDSTRLSHPLLSQPICTALQIALVDLLASWSVFPDSVTGHSSGEIAAAYAVGVLPMEDAMAIAYHRGDAASKVAMSAQVKGAMLAVGMSVDQIEPYLKALNWGKVVVACKNSPSSLTISGDLAAIEELDQSLREKQVFSRRLAVDVAYHSHHMELIREEYLASIAHIKTRVEEDSTFQSSISFFSSVMGAEVPISELGPEYWVKNLLGQVRFAEALQTLCFETNKQRHARGVSSDKRQKRAGAARKVSVDHLVEIGPHSALSGPIKQILKANEKLSATNVIYGSVLTRKIDAVTSALALAATLATSGCSLAFGAINHAHDEAHDQELRSLVDLPPYTWNHSKSYWAEPRLSKVYRGRKFPRTDLLGVPDNMSCPFEPRWRNFIRVSEIPWLSDHKIQSNIVYPGAGYIVMAIEACSQHASEHLDGTITGYRLRDVAIQSALVINEASAVEVMVSLRPSSSNQSGSSSEWCEFRIYSVTIGNRWTEHCKGLVCVESDHEARYNIDEFGEPNLSIDNAINGDLSVLDVGQFYEKLANAGLEYGSSFTNMVNAHFTDNACFAEIIIPDTAAVMPMNFQHPFVVHPCLLDSTFHTIFVPLIASMKGMEETPVPVFISQMYVGKDITSSPGGALEVQTRIDKGEECDIVASITGRTRNSRSEIPALSINGLRCKRLAQNTTRNTAKNVDRIAYKLRWDADPDLLTADSITRLIGGDHVIGTSADSESKLYEECAAHLIQKFVDCGKGVDVTTTKPHLKQLWSLLTNVDNSKSPRNGDCDPERAKAAGVKGKLLCAVGENLAAIFRNEVDVPAMLKDHGLGAYWDNALHLLEGHRAVSKYLRMVGHKNPGMSVLEVEAGAGGASMAILQQLTQESDGVPRFGKYTCTAPDASTFEASAEKLAKWRQWIEFRALEIGGNLEDQGFGSHAYDVVVVPHGLYTAASRSRVLRNIRTLLRPNGHLILVDPNHKRAGLVDNLIFGALPGWWTDSPDISPNGGISEKEWHQALCETQFSGTSAFIECGSNEAQGTCSVIIARLARDVQFTPRDALIIAEDSNCDISLPYLQSHLAELNFNVEVSEISHADPTDRVCIVLNEMKTSIFSHANEAMLDKVKQIFLHSAGVVWVTRGGRITPTNPDAGLVMGFARTARSESGVSPILTLDFDGQKPVSDELAAEKLCDLIRHRFVEGDGADDDVEYVEHDGVLSIPRVVEDGQLNRQIASLHDNQTLSEQRFHQEGRPIRGVVNREGERESVYFVDDHKIPALPNDFVGIKIQANCLSKNPKSSARLSSGCSGTVYAVGDAVRDFSPGDRVACLGTGSITSVLHDQTPSFQQIPDDMSFENAAALPAVYCTAYYLVNHIARVDSQDKILVVGAEDAVGQALLELCARRQARTFATVRTGFQKDGIISRSHASESQVFIDGNDDFARSLHKMNIQGGFSVVINCRESVDKNARLIGKCIMPYGRYIHLGKATSENVYPEKAILSTHFDIEELRRQRPGVVESVWGEVMSLVTKRALQGPYSLDTFSMSSLEEALRSLPETDGKAVVVTARPGDIVKATLPKKSNELLRADASYLLVGGLGGIGRAIALWMAEHGARNLIFVNRSGLSNEAAQVTVQALKEKGVNVAVHGCNVSDEKQFQRLTTELRETAPPIRGVIQAAMVLRDIHIEQMTVEDYYAVLQPKYAATWNLHRHLPSDMDFFLMLSSISGVIGNATQAAYAAGSTFMDSFAAYRSSLGLPAVSLDLGVITDVGYLAENKELAARMARQGFQGTDTATLMSLIKTAIAEPRRDTDGVSSQIITGLGKWKEGQSLSNFDAPLFAHFRRQYLGNGPGSRGEDAAETFREELPLAKSLDEAAGIICSALSRKICAHLSVPADSIKPSNPISEYGIDSHVAVELRNWASKKMESTVPILDILASGSLFELSSKIAAKSRLVQVGED